MFRGCRRGAATVRRSLLALALAFGLAPGASASTTCRQALVFALDVSASIDAAEYRQQLNGLAAALRHPDVLAAILASRDAPIAVAAFEFSSTYHSELIVDWTPLRSEADVAAVATQLRNRARPSTPARTAIGAGLRRAAAILGRAPDCWSQTVDISADGENNDGPPPLEVHEADLLGTATVNALVVGSDTTGAHADLEAIADYYLQNVVRGPAAFVEIARSYEDYALAMRRKLLREIAGVPGAPAPRPGAKPGPRG